MLVDRIIGERFGKLTVISKAKRENYVTCRCDCGTVKDIRATSLTKKKCPSRSCGCGRKEILPDVGRRTIAKNSTMQVGLNRYANTNFGSIQCENISTNTSGKKGVSWNKGHEKWQAYIHVHRKRIHLGYFEDIYDAIKARIAAEEKYFDPLLELRSELIGGIKK